ncbi:hypothetical protein J3458_002810 [Metarhizium acridum]|uniref:uncharacterized protein n=1 Tax=Metarhizium acridum TaxID=92637 RepID=UPI001C6CBC4B|nr:hypothetical protein J3458_002810 [Metarhizium acridum]
MDSSETSPLLSPVKSHQGESTRIERKKASPAVIVLLLLLYTIFLDLSFFLMEPAQTRILERIYCREYYQEHDPSLIGSDGRDGVDEEWCKVSWVQGEVAMLKGWQLTFDSLGSGFFFSFDMPLPPVGAKYPRHSVDLLHSMGLRSRHVRSKASDYACECGNPGETQLCAVGQLSRRSHTTAMDLVVGTARCFRRRRARLHRSYAHHCL